MRYIFKFLIPGLLLIGTGFLVGAQPNLLFAMLGFLSFFVLGVILIFEGWRRRGKENDESS